MNVDRARFLLLTTALSAATAVALSAGGCTVKQSDDDGGTVTPPVTGDAATGTDASTDAYSAPDGDASDASTCLADDGIAPTCEGTTDVTCSTVCSGYVTNFKKGVGRSITECILKLPACEGADTAIAACVQTALGAACEDPSAKTFCTPLVAGCGYDGGAGSGSLDQTECEGLATGLSDAGRAAFTACVTEGTPGGCGSDPSFCFDLIE